MSELARVPRTWTTPPAGDDVRPALAAIERAVTTGPAEELPEFAGWLGKLGCLIAQRLALGPSTAVALAAPDRRLEPKAAVEKLHRSTSWLARHRSELPFTIPMPGGRFLYSEQGIERWLRRRQNTP